MAYSVICFGPRKDGWYVPADLQHFKRMQTNSLICLWLSRNSAIIDATLIQGTCYKFTDLRPQVSQRSLFLLCYGTRHRSEHYAARKIVGWTLAWGSKDETACVGDGSAFLHSPSARARALFGQELVVKFDCLKGLSCVSGRIVRRIT